MSGFTKLFSSITHSTVWMEPDHVRLVWITMLALADKDGQVLASVPGLAHAARIDLPRTEEALAALAGPDPYSRTKDHEGRRIEEIDGGWLLLNHGKYRAARNAEERRVYKADWMRQKREAERTAKSTVDKSGQNGPGCTEAEAEAEARNPPKAPPSGGQSSGEGRTRKRAGEPKTRLKTWLASLGPDEKAIPPGDPIFEYADQAGIPREYLALAWSVFRTEFLEKDKLYADWRAVFRNYVRKGYLRLWTPAAAGGYDLTPLGVQSMRAWRASHGA